MPPLTLVSAVLGAVGVTLGALGAHALQATLATRGATATWDTAILYHLVHAVALVAICVRAETPALRRTGWLWVGGIVLFSGSLYILALGGPRWLGPVTPLGGVALIAGWLNLALVRRGTVGQ